MFFFLFVVLMMNKLIYTVPSLTLKAISPSEKYFSCGLIIFLTLDWIRYICRWNGARHSLDFLRNRMLLLIDCASCHPTHPAL